MADYNSHLEMIKAILLQNPETQNLETKNPENLKLLLTFDGPHSFAK